MVILPFRLVLNLLFNIFKIMIFVTIFVQKFSIFCRRLGHSYMNIEISYFFSSHTFVSVVSVQL